MIEVLEFINNFLNQIKTSSLMPNLLSFTECFKLTFKMNLKQMRENKVLIPKNFIF